MSTAYLVAGVRTPIGRYAGGLAPVRTDDLAAHAVSSLVDRFPAIDWGRVDDVILGCANQAGEDNRNVARMAGLLAGLPVQVPGLTVNRLCASGLDAVGAAARAIRAGDADLVIAGGVESMTRAPLVMPKPDSAWSRRAEVHDTTIGWRFVNPRMDERYGTDSMPGTAQIVADEYDISREDQDAFALRSQERAAKAIASGRLAREIVPVEIQGRKGAVSVVDTDEHPRTTSLEALANLRPIFPGGSVTAGNASGVNDGAAALLVASEAAVSRYGLTPLARITTSLSVGVEPRVMGMGPDPAVKALLARTGLEVGDIDLFELNEAFASQSLAVLRALGLPDDAEHVNPNGGAIALGHPLGMSGARLALTAAVELADRGVRRALATMCVGVGQGGALLLEAV
ncbi:3-oxoadipyl-CoA thiolase [Intrasporangium calvum]|uniref:Beta-ketoadipyl-CoA thiolase n=1 Tax=Intrasporangium calvum (strain ATCC 23552 / DSM 43043 / JCM 3097 / NBRC 12989 / NCIMB 10167 / NRRL B-3866 / 7 KIP) TaxID=710696 RepID=E6S822_INTC7|nr:3-oxoadipyl-CoA thiolase [Intrasporangium calvum]ADU46926.1 beta-ketoadipyl CoA thiolase [Intrasporangium calvum DSM 43043]